MKLPGAQSINAKTIKVKREKSRFLNILNSEIPPH